MFSYPGDIPEGVYGDTAGTFRVSGYRCPHCSLRLYKTTFPEGRDPRLYVGPDGGSYMEPARVFGSPCGRFFAAPKGRRLSEGFFLQAVLVLDRQDKRQGEDFVKWWNDFSTMGDLNARRRE